LTQGLGTPIGFIIRASGTEVEWKRWGEKN